MPKMSVSESLTTENHVLRNKAQVRILAVVCYRYESLHSMAVKHLLHVVGNKSFIIALDVTPSEITWSFQAAIIRICLKFLKIEDNFLY